MEGRGSNKPINVRCFAAMRGANAPKNGATGSIATLKTGAEGRGGVASFSSAFLQKSN